MFIFHLFHSKCFALQKIYRLPNSQPCALLGEQNWLLRAEIQTSHSRSDLLAELPHAAAPCLALAGKVQRMKVNGEKQGSRSKEDGEEPGEGPAVRKEQVWRLEKAALLHGCCVQPNKNCLESRREWRGAFLRACAQADRSQKRQHQRNTWVYRVVLCAEHVGRDHQIWSW